MIDLDVIQTAISNMLANGIAFFPRLLTGLLVLLLGWIVGRIIAALTRRLAQRVGLDRIVDRTGVGDALRKAEIKRPASDLLATFLFWTVFLNFLLIGLESMGLNAAVEPLRNLIALLPRFLVAMATLVGGILLAQFLGRSAQAAMAGVGIEFHQQLGQGVNALLLVMVVVVVLEQLGIDASILTTIFTNVITLVVAGMALAFGLAGRHVAQNVLAGYYAREQFAPGDDIRLGDIHGTLEGIGTLNAEISTADGRITIPNTRLTDEAVCVREPDSLP
ncbi:MAG: mechanosensitive ion channel [Anaerolineales bacterium]|nr:mechanosensitive ion channel [Anaerolineales bacterium]